MTTAKVLPGVFLMLALAACSRPSRDDLIQEGLRQSQERNFRGAVVLFKSVLERDAEDLQARFLLADAYLKGGQVELAEQEFTRVAARDPDYPGLPRYRPGHRRLADEKLAAVPGSPAAPGKTGGTGVKARGNRL